MPGDLFTIEYTVVCTIIMQIIGKRWYFVDGFLTRFFMWLIQNLVLTIFKRLKSEQKKLTEKLKLTENSSSVLPIYASSENLPFILFLPCTISILIHRLSSPLALCAVHLLYKMVSITT